jgi:sugar/nucleoside kinase (ribokinase family)
MNASPHQPIGIVGNLNVDQIIATVSRFPKWDEELLVDSSHLELAGTAGYIALAAKALGMEPCVVSTIGDDPNGAFLRAGLAAAGIDDRDVVTIAGASTCIGMIFVGPEGQRGILSVLGAHEQMTVDVAMQVDVGITQCQEVFLCGNYLLPQFSPRDVIPYARMCRGRGQVVVFDPSWDPAGWTEATRSATFALLEEVDLYMPNEEEICHLTGTSTWQEAARIVAPLAREVVIKRGANGAVHIANDAVTEIPAVPIVPVNTIGAGDVFDVSFLYGRRHAWPVDNCLRFACAAAAHVVAQTGPRTYPDQAAIETFAGLESTRC